MNQKLIQKIPRNKNNRAVPTRRSFTITEMMIVIVIAAIVAILALPSPSELAAHEITVATQQFQSDYAALQAWARSNQPITLGGTTYLGGRYSIFFSGLGISPPLAYRLSHPGNRTLACVSMHGSSKSIHTMATLGWIQSKSVIRDYLPWMVAAQFMIPQQGMGGEESHSSETLGGSDAIPNGGLIPGDDTGDADPGVYDEGVYAFTFQPSGSSQWLDMGYSVEIPGSITDVSFADSRLIFNSDGTLAESGWIEIAARYLIRFEQSGAMSIRGAGGSSDYSLWRNGVNAPAEVSSVP